VYLLQFHPEDAASTKTITKKTVAMEANHAKPALQQSSDTKSSKNQAIRHPNVFPTTARL